jgi:tetratricopeptide (TPR) repeat protein
MMDDVEPSTRRPQTPPMPPVAPMPVMPLRPPSAPEFSSPLPPPTRPHQRSIPVVDDVGSSMRPSLPSEDVYSVPRGRRVGGWVVAFVLMMAVGVVGWVVAKPYLVARDAGAAAQLDPRAQGFVTDGERALADGNLDMAKEDLDKASALAEADPHVLLDQARLACALADVPWLKSRLLAATAADAVDEQRATKAQLDERVARAKSAADQALAIAPSDVAAMRAKIDALRLSGERDAARGYVSKVISQASQPETAYVLAALDLAEPEPLWTTVIDRLRFAAAGEGNAGRARAALTYALAKSGDMVGAKAELAKLDALPRPYPDLANLHAFIDHSPVAAGGPGAKPGPDAGVATAGSKGEAAAAAAPLAPSPQGVQGAGAQGGAAQPAAAPAAGGDGLQAASQAIRKGDWERARQIYDALVARNPSDSEALCGLGDVARAQGDNGGAIAAYKHVISINPSYLPALLGLADTEWASGNKAGAVQGYRDIADRFPDGTYPAYVKQRTDVPAPAAASAASSPSAARVPAGTESAAGE